ncbi:MAG: LytTR family transcriptional regulator [Bacteroidales bacterium]|nr:LytTR family transcriptional regulator [Bacteroidales bacterium]
MNTKLNNWLQLVKSEAKLFLWISVGIFLFILFFQPFPPDAFDFNNRLLFIAGLGAIVFVFMVLTKTLFPHEQYPDRSKEQHQHFPVFMSSIILIILISVAFAFYIRYVGAVKITFFIMFKVVLIAIVPPIVIKLHHTFRELKQQNENLQSAFQSNHQQIEKLKEDYLNKTIIFNSENNTESLSLLLFELVLIKSADNYVEIVFKDGEQYVKKLLRNTMKNIELQLQPYSNFIRCHRISIINIHHIHRLEAKNQNHWITIMGLDEQIPVSRQYLQKVKEAL